MWNVKLQFPFVPHAAGTQFLKHCTGTSPSKRRWVGHLLPRCHCGEKMWVQTRFQKQMSNLHFSVWSKRREHAAASSEAGRTDPRVQVPGHLSLPKCYYRSQNRLVLSVFDSLPMIEIPEKTSHKPFCFISKMSEIPVLKWVGISVTAPCSHVSPRTDQKVGTKHPCCCLQGSTPARAMASGYPGRPADSDRHDLAFLHQISKHLTDPILLMST